MPYVTTSARPSPNLRSRPRHLYWWLQGVVLAVGLVMVVVVGGTLGYVLIEGWSVWDAFYMTVITITTVGYREVHDLSTGGRMFTVVLVASGVGTAFYTFSLLTAQLVESNLGDRLEARRHQRMLDELHDHFIVCGFGRIGSVIVGEFLRQSTPCVVIESDGPHAGRAGTGRDRRRGRCQPGGGTEPGPNRSSARSGRGRRHGRSERVHRAQRSAAPTRPVHSRTRRERGHGTQDTPRGRQPGDLAVPHRCGPDGPDRPASSGRRFCPAGHRCAKLGSHDA